MYHKPAQGGGGGGGTSVLRGRVATRGYHHNMCDVPQVGSDVGLAG